MLRKNLIYLIVFMLLTNVATALANEPYGGYLYSPWDDEVSAPNGYIADGVFNGEAWGIGHLKGAMDLCVYDGKIYVMDTGNNRIVVINDDFTDAYTMTEFKQGQETFEFNSAKGIFVNSTGIYVADTENKRILVSDLDGTLKSIIEKPTSFIYPQQSDFRPEKLSVAKQGNIYCLINGIYLGVANFDASFEFQGFLGSNKVELNIGDRLDYLWKQILTNDQKSKMARFVPVEYSNLTIDRQDFVYTATAKTQSSLEEIKKINSAGKNVLVNNYGKSLNFGDRNTGVYRGRRVINNFVDLDVDSEDFINVLDSTYGRIFQYSPEADLIFTFGGIGTQNGLFTIPSAIGSSGNRIFVLDSEKNNITAFKPNAYGLMMREAVVLHSKGMYEQAVDKWDAVLSHSSYSELAYYGMGKAYTQTGDYTKAMEMFELSNSKRGYSKAFKFQRNQVMRENFPYIALALILTAVGFWIYKKYFKKPKVNENVKPSNRFRYPFYIIFHPSEGFEELKYAKNGSVLFAHSILALMVLFSIVSSHKTGFIFSHMRPDDFNIFVMLISTLGVFLLYTVANWSVSALADGEGNFREIYTFSAYALIPAVLVVIPQMVLSHTLTLDEGVFITYLTLFADIWTAYLLFTSLRVSHQYSAPKTIAVLIMIAVVMAFIVFLGVLMLSLFSQLISFIKTVGTEIYLRFYY